MFWRVEMTKPTPHGPKLRELISNPKLPAEDLQSVKDAIKTYEKWISDMSSLKSTGENKVKDLVKLVNAYKRYIDIDLIWDSQSDFLFRQRGQLKLDNSITEEFLPWLVDPSIIAGIDNSHSEYSFFSWITSSHLYRARPYCFCSWWRFACNVMAWFSARNATSSNGRRHIRSVRNYCWSLSNSWSW